MQNKLLIFIVAYRAEAHIASVLDRIPLMYWESDACEILIIDDASTDGTVEACKTYRERTGRIFTLLQNPINQGYGGNQKLGYTYALKNGFDAVVLLHGDGQYPPETIPDLVAPLMANEADACFGSRMLQKRQALKGGMPFYKFAGNIVLTKLQNCVVGTQLSEYHSGFRAYRVDALAKIPFKYNSDDFDFDTDIIIQFAFSNQRIREIPIPTRYGDEVCHVNGMRYARQIVRSSLLARMQKFQTYYQPKFDFEGPLTHYPSKTSFDSTHRWAIDEVHPRATVVDIGLGSGAVAQALVTEKNATVHGYDYAIRPEAATYCASTTVINLDNETLTFPPNATVDYVLLLDVLEHLSQPEAFLQHLRTILSPHQGCVLVSTANIGFIVMRLSLLTGRFNYGKRGILDLTHKRLFTFYSLKRILKEQGYILESAKGIPVPFELMFGKSMLTRILLGINHGFMRLSRSTFSFQMVIRARPKPTLEHLLETARSH